MTPMGAPAPARSADRARLVVPTAFHALYVGWRVEARSRPSQRLAPRAAR